MDEPGRRTLDLDRLKPEPVQVPCNRHGTLYVWPLTVGRFAELSKKSRSQERKEVGREVLLASVSLTRDSKAVGDPALDPRELTDSDVKTLIRAAAESNKWPVPAEPTYEDLGSAFLTAVEGFVKPITDSVLQLQKDLKGPLMQLSTSFSKSTLDALTRQIATSERLDSALRQAAWVDELRTELIGRSAIETAVSAGAASIGRIDSGILSFPIPDGLKIDDRDTVFENRLAEGVEAAVQKLGLIAELNRNTLQQLSEVSALGGRIMAENLAAQEKARREAQASLNLASSNLKIAKYALVATVILSALQLGLAWSDRQGRVAADVMSRQVAQSQLDATLGQARETERVSAELETTNRQINRLIEVVRGLSGTSKLDEPSKPKESQKPGRAEASSDRRR